jgi:anionic cell wall polymer biosynthesis LytR-Cps2A-Psr (LCP) family protein
VYVDIDRPYDDGKIQFEPGYQLLDGSGALGYARTRHDQNYDFGRMERQQRIVSAVREQAMG